MLIASVMARATSVFPAKATTHEPLWCVPMAPRSSTVNDRDGGLLRRIRRGRDGREVVIIDNRPRGPRGVGGFFVALPPPVLRIPQDRYIVEAEGAPPELIYDTLVAPPVDRIERAYSLDEIRYSPSVRQRMPSIDLDTINFETGSWEIPRIRRRSCRRSPMASTRALQRNPSAVFLIEGHTDAVGNDVDNLSLSDRRAESAATLLTEQFRRACRESHFAGLRRTVP